MEPVPAIGLATVCLTNREYYGMIIVMFIFMALMVTVTITAGIYYKYDTNFHTKKINFYS